MRRSQGRRRTSRTQRTPLDHTAPQDTGLPPGPDRSRQARQRTRRQSSCLGEDPETSARGPRQGGRRSRRCRRDDHRGWRQCRYATLQLQALISERPSGAGPTPMFVGADITEDNRYRGDGRTQREQRRARVSDWSQRRFNGGVTDLRHEQLRSATQLGGPPAAVDEDLDTPSGAPLRSLAPLLRNEPGLTRAFGEPDARLAVVEVARPISIAALATLSNRRPLLVACPTGTMARQLHDDLSQFLDEEERRTFPRVGNAPLRTRQPQRRDDGAAPRRAVAPPGYRPGARK